MDGTYQRGISDDREVEPFDMNRVQFIDRDAQRRANECALIVMREYFRLAKQPAHSELDQALMQGYPQPDGSLLVRSVSPDGRNQDTVVPAAGWRQLSVEDYERLDLQMREGSARQPGVFEASVDHMAELIKRPGDHFAIAAAAVGQKTDHAAIHVDSGPEEDLLSAISTEKSYAIVLDRSDVAAVLIGQIDEQVDLKEHIHTDAFRFWQQSDHQYAVLWGTASHIEDLTLMSADLSAVLSEALPKVMHCLKQKGGLCTFLIGVDPAASKAIEDRLSQLQAISG